MKPIEPQKKNTSFLYGLAVAQIIAGIPVAIVSMIIIAAGFFTFRGTGGLYYALQLIMIPVCTGGALLIRNGMKQCRFIENYRKLSAVMEYKNREKLPALAKATGQSMTGLVRDLRVMAQKGYFPEAHVDLNRCEFALSGSVVPAPMFSDGDIFLKESARPSFLPLLAFPYAILAYFIIKPYTSLFDLLAAGGAGVIICAVAWKNCPNIRGIAEKKYKALPAQAPLPIDTGNDALDDLLNAAMDHVGALNRLSLSITNPKMIQPVKELLDVSRQIFAFVEGQPEKIRQIRQFMNYYLPTTIKLLQSYQEFSRQPVKGENITDSMHKIEGSMDEITKIFKRELDNLYSDKAEDLSIDVDVMLAMMRQQGIENEIVKENK